LKTGTWSAFMHHDQNQSSFASDGWPTRMLFLARSFGGYKVNRGNCLKSVAGAMIAGALAAGMAGCHKPAPTPPESTKLLVSGDMDHLPAHRAHRQCVFSVAFSPDGTLLASAGGDQQDAVNLWSIPDGRLLRKLKGHKGGVASVAFSRDGKLLASGGLADYDTINLWWMPDGKLRKALSGGSFVRSLAFSPDGSLLAWCSGEKKLSLWSLLLDRSKATLGGRANWALNPVAFSPDGQLLASAGSGDTIKLWSVTEGKVQSTLNLNDYHTLVYSVAFSPDGKLLAVGAHGLKVRLYPLPTGSSWVTLEGQSTTVDSVAFSPDGNWLAAAGENERESMIELWSGLEGKLEATFRGRSRKMYTVAFSPDGKLLAAGDGDGHIFLRELDGQKRWWALFDSSFLDKGTDSEVSTGRNR
jgi:WD40 repeat protein